MARALKVCSTPRCPNLVTAGRCPGCKAAAEARRGTARQRGYDNQHETRFRAKVLQRDPLCVCEDQDHGHSRPCLRPSVHADHHPLSRRDLTDAGLDPNDPKHGRGLCTSCHSKHTSEAQPGGWNAR